jgi:MFS family permease
MIHLRALRDKAALRKTATSIFLVLNSFVWYILTYAVFYTIVDEELNLLGTEKLILFATYYIGITISVILGAKFFPRSRTKALNLWLFMGTIATLLLTTISGNGMLNAALLAFFLGASIGIGLPSCLSYFADSTSIENRGIVGGIIWSTVGFTVLIFAFIIDILGQWETQIVALAIWRLLGSVSFLFLNRNRKFAAQKAPSYLELIHKREVLLYLFPWVMFSIINFAETPLLESVFGRDFAFVQLMEWALMGIFAIVGGVVADFAGRKRVVIAGFVMLGIEYAALSAFSGSSATLYLFLALDGITWGLLASVFFMALWGDLGENREKEKYYALGGLPYLLAGFLPILIKLYASDVDVSTTIAFSLASFFLFLAVIPLMYAPETLPEKVIKDRDLKSYVEKAKQKVQKEAEKSQKKHADKAEKDNEKGKEEPEETPEDAEARKLAEKYY